MTIRIIGEHGPYATIRQDSKWEYNKSLLTIENTGVAFACCGARCINTFDGVFAHVENGYVKTPAPTEADLNALKAEFLVSFLSNFSERYTYYGIVTTMQRRVYEKSDRFVLHLLLEMGAEFVDERPNSLHGPNELCMLVWCPYVHREKLDKYVSRSVNSDWPVAKVTYHAKFEVEATKPKASPSPDVQPTPPRNPNDRVA